MAWRALERFRSDRNETVTKGKRSARRAQTGGDFRPPVLFLTLSVARLMLRL
jgi:hypothetical protein